ISRNPDTKIRSVAGFYHIVQVLPPGNVLDLPDQLIGIGMPAFCRLEITLVLHGISTERHNILNTEVMAIHQHVLGLFTGKSATKYVRNGIHLIFMLYGSTYPHGPRTHSYDLPVQQTIPLYINIFFPGGGHVDKRRIELHKGVYVIV